MAKLRVLDLFSCVGCHAIGLHRTSGFETTKFIEANPWRREILAKRFPEILQHDDVRTYNGKRGEADIAVGGPPCQRTSKASAIHGYRTGESLWAHMRRIGLNVGVEWFVVEQPPGNATWEAEVSDDLSRAGYHCARIEFEARDCGAPYPRRRVFILACASLPRLEIAWSAVPREIDSAKRAADARGDWDANKLAAIRVDARSAGEMDRSVSRLRRERIEALGDSNPPIMMTVIGHAILQARAAA